MASLCARRDTGCPGRLLAGGGPCPPAGPAIAVSVGSLPVCLAPNPDPHQSRNVRVEGQRPACCWQDVTVTVACRRELGHQTPSLDPGQSPPHRPRAVWRKAPRPTQWCVYPGPAWPPGSRSQWADGAPAVGAPSGALGSQGARDHSGGPANCVHAPLSEGRPCLLGWQGKGWEAHF